MYNLLLLNIHMYTEVIKRRSLLKGTHIRHNSVDISDCVSMC